MNADLTELNAAERIQSLRKGVLAEIQTSRKVSNLNEIEL